MTIIQNEKWVALLEVQMNIVNSGFVGYFKTNKKDLSLHCTFRAADHHFVKLRF